MAGKMCPKCGKLTLFETTTGRKCTQCGYTIYVPPNGGMGGLGKKCPICGKTEFSSENSFEICNYCGWQNDGIQSEDPNFWGGANDLSLKDYKKNYQELLKVDPKYKWSKNDKKIEFEKMERNSKHLCPVCNKYFFNELDSHETCKNCGWIDNWTQEKFPDYENSSKSFMCKSKTILFGTTELL
jgi:uncharacterized protein (DUF983 family)